MSTLLVFSTFPDPGTARDIARTLVAERLVACANLLPAVTSIYVWQGKQEEAAETLVLFKTPRALYTTLETRLRALHPYEVPEIVALELTAALPAYLQWVSEQTTSPTGLNENQPPS